MINFIIVNSDAPCGSLIDHSRVMTYDRDAPLDEWTEGNWIEWALHIFPIIYLMHTN